VSFKEKRADVLYDPAEVTIKDMLSAINSIGFRAKIIGGRNAGT
jgi:copper chaperone CopZ